MKWRIDMKHTIAFALITTMLLAVPIGSATAANPPTQIQTLAQQQTSLLLKYYQGSNMSPPQCGQGQGAGGDEGVFLLPVLSFGPGDRTVNCTISTHSVLVDLGGFVITEDNRFPQSSYPLNGQPVPFSRENLEPICDDVIAQGFLGSPTPATLDGNHTVVGPVLDSGPFTAPVNRHAQVPGGADLYADSVELGHPGQLATVFCGYKAQVALSPGMHRLVVDYSGYFAGSSTVFTYDISVKD
jgi:hypothetical protein